MSSSNSAKKEVQRLEAAMAVRAPVIVWQLDPVRRVQVAVSVDDPYMTGEHNALKTHCRHRHEFTPENTIITRDGRQCRTCKNEFGSAWQAQQPARVLTPEQKARRNEMERARRRRDREQRELAAMEAEAREVAERFRQHRADNTPLQQAARAI